MDWQAAAAWGATAAFVLASAKAHGRQLRLEREARGIAHVDFRQANDPWVEALWRRDRAAFWSLFAALAIGCVLLLFLLRPAGIWAWLALALAWSFAACFVAMGLASLTRGLRAPTQPEALGPQVRQGLGGSLAWFGAAFAFAALALALAWT